MQHLKDPDTQVDWHYSKLFHAKHGRYPSSQAELAQFIREQQRR